MAAPHHRFAALATALLVASCSGGPDAAELAQAERETAASEALARIDAGPHDVAVIEIEGMGIIQVELLRELAPKTVTNFVKLAEEGFYAGTTFHRVIPGFMIQGGDSLSRNLDPRDDGKGGPGYTIEDEFTGYPHVRGTVSMANTGYPDSGGSQFFIVHEDANHLDGAYSVFGRVVEGMEVVDAITELEIDRYGRYGPTNRPYPKSAVIGSVRIGRRAAAQPAGT